MKFFLLVPGWVLEFISKIGIWAKVAKEKCFKPKEYLKYFEDLKYFSDKEIGLKSIFEISSTSFRIRP
jgi:hypothetical protein